MSTDPKDLPDGTDDRIPKSSLGDYVRKRLSQYAERIPSDNGLTTVAFMLAAREAADCVDANEFVCTEKTTEWEQRGQMPTDDEIRSYTITTDLVEALLHFFHWWSYMELPEGTLDPVAIADEREDEAAQP